MYSCFHDQDTCRNPWTHSSLEAFYQSFLYQSCLKEKEEKKKEPRENAQEKSSGGGTGEDTSSAAQGEPMEVEYAQEEEGIFEKIEEKLIGQREPTEGQ